MGALMDENPQYRMSYFLVAEQRRIGASIHRDALVRVVEDYRKKILAGEITDMVVIARDGLDVTGDWFG